MPRLENRRCLVDFERNKLDQDMILRREELRLKAEELELEKAKLEAGNRQESKKTTIAAYGTLVGVLAALGGFFGVYIQGFQNRNLEQQRFKQNIQLEQQKFQTSLIFKAVETTKPEVASRNLLFLVKAGFIEDKDRRIEQLAADPSSAPFLSSLVPIGKDGYQISAQDISDYCKRAFGSDYVPHGNQCSNGKRSRPVQISQICAWRTGSPQFTYDPISAVSRCSNSQLDIHEQELKK
jgi:hypothetical protein